MNAIKDRLEPGEEYTMPDGTVLRKKLPKKEFRSWRERNIPLGGRR
jgi:hypothetical protein